MHRYLRRDQSKDFWIPRGPPINQRNQKLRAILCYPSSFWSTVGSPQRVVDHLPNSLFLTVLASAALLAVISDEYITHVYE